jgi:microcystin-dependent protein
MSFSALKGRTPNFRFGLIRVDWPSWADEDHKNWLSLDATLTSLGIPENLGPWANATSYVVGNRVIDIQTLVIYTCLVDHTSAATGSFESDRTANPTYWDSAFVDDVVRFGTVQSLSEGQQAQARTNISAASNSDLSDAIGDITSITANITSINGDITSINAVLGTFGTAVTYNVGTGDNELLTTSLSDARYRTEAQVNAAINDALVSGVGFPPSTVIFVAQNSAPSGFLKANGALVSRSTYAALFDAIGTTYGAGDGSTTFALPDLRGEFPRGWDDGRGVDSGRTIGSAQGQQVGQHTHQLPSGIVRGTGGGTFSGNPGSNFQFDETLATAANSGGTETRPRNVALLACIKF